ncbi:MAG: hypothetical protein RIC52_09675 [Amphiplicatus sp.]
MRAYRRLGLAAAMIGFALVSGCGKKETSDKSSDAASEVNGLMTPVAFAHMSDSKAHAAALFEEMSKVMVHPRCANCHPVTGGPTQGDDMRPHEPPVVRGEGMGAAGMECTTCHGTENVEFASMEGSIPGASPWHLAPESMGWVGKSPAALCAQLKDPELNGGRSVEDLINHNGRDHLVGWAWHPGEGRSPAPGDQATFGALTAAWVEAGAHCPAG